MTPFDTKVTSPFSNGSKKSAPSQIMSEICSRLNVLEPSMFGLTSSYPLLIKGEDRLKHACLPLKRAKVQPSVGTVVACQMVTKENVG